MSDIKKIAMDVYKDGYDAGFDKGMWQERRRIFSLFDKKCRELRKVAPGLQGMSILIREVKQDEIDAHAAGALKAEKKLASPLDSPSGSIPDTSRCECTDSWECENCIPKEWKKEATR